MRFLKTALCAASVLTLAACATQEMAPPPPPPMAAPAPPPAPPAPAAAAPGAPAATAASGPTTGPEIFASRCNSCHGGNGPGPNVAVLNTFTPAFIVEALTTGKMMRQGARLSAEQKQAVATFLGKG